MTNNHKKHNRRSIRLQGYDYSRSGAYFITLCTKNMTPLFGKIMNGKMVLNGAGRVVEKYWNDISVHFKHAVLHEYIIMPDHVHGIIEIIESPCANGPSPVLTNNIDIAKHGIFRLNGPGSVGANNYSPLQQCRSSQHNCIQQQSNTPIQYNDMQHPNGTSKTIGSMIRGFKIGVTKWFRKNTDMHAIWQRNYYERIIRDQYELNNVRKYIIDNPRKWAPRRFPRPS